MTQKKAAASASDRGHKSRQRASAQNSKQAANREARIARLAPFKFKPGQSGNPGGRPKRDFAAEIAQAIFEQNADAVYKAMLKALKKGNPKAFGVLAERGYGKTPQHIELGGQLTTDVRVTFENAAASAEP